MLPDLSWMIIPIGPIHIQVWGLFVALGILIALLVAKQFARQRQLNEQWIVDGAFWIVLAALLGSRLWYLLTEWQQYDGRMLDMLKVWQGGMSFSGGLVGAALAGWLYFHYKKVKVLE
ncbi:MAG: prolipoprotein diacylglyceryl transferase, partial [Candidatus Kerfeldbacteria bacterium]|nr:prolipoprotein diacylglyceryl transferase [Candidatus Kerfeldbacteria bacterium]